MCACVNRKMYEVSSERAAVETRLSRRRKTHTNKSEALSFFPFSTKIRGVNFDASTRVVNSSHG